MDSPIEKWNLIIGNLALKQVITQPAPIQHPVKVLAPSTCSQFNFGIIIGILCVKQTQKGSWFLNFSVFFVFLRGKGGSVMLFVLHPYLKL